MTNILDMVRRSLLQNRVYWYLHGKSKRVVLSDEVSMIYLLYFVF